MTCSKNNNKRDMESVSQGDYKKYKNEVKKQFINDFVNTPIYRNNKRISVGKTQEEIDKCFDHITSVGSMDSKTRLPDLRRMECIYILKSILTDKDCQQCKNYYVWEKEEKYLKEKIFCPETGYLIILNKRNFIYKIVSAYFIESPSKRKKLVSECQETLKSK